MQCDGLMLHAPHCDVVMGRPHLAYSSSSKMGVNIDQGRETETEHGPYLRARLHQKSAPISPEGRQERGAAELWGRECRSGKTKGRASLER